MQKKRLKRGRDPRSNRVSIYTATFNPQLDILREVFNRIKAQSYRDWEWVIFDDSTEDHVWPELLKFEKEHLAVKIYTYRREGIEDKYIVSERRSNNKVGFVKKLCCELSTGKFLLELDHDDYLTPDALEMIIAASKQFPDAGFFYSDFLETTFDLSDFKYYPDHWGQGFGAHYWFWEKEHNLYALASRAPDINYTTLSHITGIPNHVRVWTRDAYEAAGGYNSDLPVCDDYELFLKTIIAGVEVVKIPLPLYHQHLHPAQTQNTYKPLIKSLANELWETYSPELQKLFPGHEVDSRNCFEYYHTNPKLNKLYNPAPQRVSVIIPTWKRGPWLIKALNSLLEQTYKDLEIIIIGDACNSIDRIMRDWYRGQLKIKWFNLETNYGVGGATPRNYALKNLATGTYITYLDNDNTIEPTHIEDLVNAMEGVDYAFTDINMGPRTLKCREPKRYRIDTSSIMHKKELLDAYGYWKTREEAGYAHDWELVSRWEDHKFKATGKATLNYNLEFNDQDIDGIFNAYKDQE